MSKYQVGDEVLLTKIENAYGEDHSSGYDLPMMVRIRYDESRGGSYDYGVETLDGKWLSSVFEKNLRDAPKVTRQTQIVVEEGNISVRHTTNTKKQRVSFTGYRMKGHIHLEDIDKVIRLLTKLKSEV